MGFTNPNAFALALLLTGLVAAAAVMDVRSGRIPNAYLLVVAGLGLLANVAVTGVPGALFWSLGGLGTGLAVWLAPFALRWVGAADAKLFAAVGAWLGPLAILRVSLLAAVFGGLLGLGYLLVRRLTRRGSTRALALNWRALGSGLSWVSVSAADADGPQASGAMPYAIAVLAGTVVELFLLVPSW